MKRQEIGVILQSTWLTSIDWTGIGGMRYHVVKNQYEDGDKGYTYVIKLLKTKRKL